MKKSLIAMLITSCFTLTALAADQIAKEDTTPPPAEGPLTADQIPPYNSMPLANKPVQPIKPAASGEPITSPNTPQPAVNPEQPTIANPEQPVSNPQQFTPPNPGQPLPSLH